MFKPIKSCIFAGALACALTGTVLAAGPLKPVDNPAPIAAKGIGQTQALNAVKYASSRGLDAGPCQNDAKQICLHRNVNKWMANLASDITKELGRAH